MVLPWRGRRVSRGRVPDGQGSDAGNLAGGEGGRASRSEPEAADVTRMGTVKRRPMVMAPVRRRRRVLGWSAEAAIAAQMLVFPQATEKSQDSTDRWWELPLGRFPTTFLLFFLKCDVHVRIRGERAPEGRSPYIPYKTLSAAGTHIQKGFSGRSCTLFHRVVHRRS